MKKLVIVFLVLCVASFGFAGDKCVGENACKSVGVEGVSIDGGVCPSTNVKMGCYVCHYPGADFKKVKKTPYREYLEPIPVVSDPFDILLGSKLSGDGVGLFSYWVLGSITDSTPNEFSDIYQHAKTHNIKHIVIELQSFGGSLLDAWRTIGLMDEAKEDGIVIETRCHGYAMSAGTLIFVNGTMGKRFVSTNSLFMFHELATFVFKRATPSSSEDEARLMRMMQDRLNEFLAGRTKIPKETWDEHVRKNEFWCGGVDAVKYGIADTLIGE